MINLETGYIPPQAVPLEREVLGCILMQPESLVNIVDILRPESFYKDTHRVIFEAIMALYAKFEPVDAMTVTVELQKRGLLDQVGGPYELSKLTDKIGSTANIESHARIIQEAALKRQVIEIGNAMVKDGYDDLTDCFDLLEKAETALMNLSQSGSKSDFDRIDKLTRLAIDDIQNIKNQGFTGCPSGFTAIDRFTGGWQKTDLIILAGRPGMGKTALALKFMRNASVDWKKPAAIFSLEMSKLQLTKRLLSDESELNHNKFKTGDLHIYEWEQLNSKIKNILDAPIFVDDTPSLTIFELRAKARRMKMRFDIQLILVDYIQLVRGEREKNGNREQEISSISRALKALAKELDVPVIALSQLSRQCEQRPGKRPQLSDLRESGAIEQDADMVVFLFRPEYYKIMEWQDGSPTQGQAEVIIAKHRNGATGEARIRFVPEFVRFTELDDNIEIEHDTEYKF